MAGNETDAEKRGRENGREGAVGLQLLRLRAVAWQSLVVMVMDVKVGYVVTAGDDDKGGGGWVLSASIIPTSLTALYQTHLTLTQPNCGTLEKRVMFTLIVMQPRWRLLRDAKWSDGGRQTSADMFSHDARRNSRHMFSLTFTWIHLIL